MQMFRFVGLGIFILETTQLFRAGAMDARLRGISLARRLSARPGAMLMRELISLSPSVLMRRLVGIAGAHEVDSPAARYIKRLS